MISESPAVQARTSSAHRVERAIGEMRRGWGVVIEATGHAPLLVASAEEINAGLKERFATPGPVDLVLSSKRAVRLWPDHRIGTAAVSIRLPKMCPDMFSTLVGFKAGPIPKLEISPADAVQEAALALMKLAELLPAAYVAELTPEAGDFLVVSADEILDYSQYAADTLTPVAAAPLTLRSGGKAEITAFRPESGGKEHYAIRVFGENPGAIPFVRIHSSCFTGDLLGSLACDCRDQLHAAIEYMRDHGGGVILYLMQEGRGIGLVNKLRAYKLQAEGMDTVDANEELGFDDDERPFLPAAIMLRHMNISKIKLLTNNPRKASELQRLGIEVVERVPLEAGHNPHNAGYLKTKSERLGHLFSHHE